MKAVRGTSALSSGRSRGEVRVSTGQLPCGPCGTSRTRTLEIESPSLFVAHLKHPCLAGGGAGARDCCRRWRRCRWCFGLSTSRREAGARAGAWATPLSHYARARRPVAPERPDALARCFASHHAPAQAWARVARACQVCAALCPFAPEGAFAAPMGQSLRWRVGCPLRRRRRRDDDGARRRATDDSQRLWPRCLRGRA